MFDLDSSHFRGNHLLASLPDADYSRMLPDLEAIHLDIKDHLYEHDQPIQFVYFPLSGMASILTVLGSNHYIEAGIVGCEGVVGLPVFLGAETTPTTAFYQIPGIAVRMPSAKFQAEIQRRGVLESLLKRFAHAHLTMLTQNIACNSQHSIEQRCARWLLLSHDRMDKDEFMLTQEFLSQMLGVRRAGVSSVMHSLQKAGLIHYTRGIITILNRAGLQKLACQCYGIIAKAYRDNLS
ncbi:MAG: Crp/Fnr family transcriptional regulator [Chloroflexota bacterium]